MNLGVPELIIISVICSLLCLPAAIAAVFAVYMSKKKKT
jgi:hypothetical protein